MAKKKTVRKKKGTTQRNAKKASVKKRAGVKKAAKKKSASKKKTAAKTAAKKSHTAKKRVKKKAARRPRPALGRPRVSGTTKLDLFLRHDYEAQQVFQFLNVSTVKELEAHSPDEIIGLLTAPVVKTVDKIRKALALNNRCLTGDQRFALQFQKSFQQR